MPSASKMAVQNSVGNNSEMRELSSDLQIEKDCTAITYPCHLWQQSWQHLAPH
jgi:hypothetical protein